MSALDPWQFWLLFYWLVMYAVFLGWYVKNKGDKMHPLVAFFSFFLVGLAPLVLIILGFKKTKD